MLVTSDNLWERSHEDKYKEKKELSAKNTEVLKQYLKYPM